MGMASGYVIVTENVTTVTNQISVAVVQCSVPCCNNRNDASKIICY